MLALAFECAGSGLNAALAEDGDVLAREQLSMDRGQPAVLVPTLQALFKSAHRQPGALDRIGVTLGPGGFTGIRLGIATGLGLARSAGADFFGLNAFDVFAAPESDTRNLGVVIESRREELFVRTYDATGAARTPDGLLTPQEIDERFSETRWIGSASSRVATDTVDSSPDMAWVARHLSKDPVAPGWLRNGQGQQSPLYMRAPEIGAPKNQ